MTGGSALPSILCDAVTARREIATLKGTAMNLKIGKIAYDLTETELRKPDNPNDNRRGIVTTKGIFWCTPGFDAGGNDVTDWSAPDLPDEIIPITWDIPDLTARHLPAVRKWYQDFKQSEECPEPPPSFEEYRTFLDVVKGCWEELATATEKEPFGYRDMFTDGMNLLAALFKAGNRNHDEIMSRIRGLRWEARKKGNVLLWLCDVEPIVATPASGQGSAEISDATTEKIEAAVSNGIAPHVKLLKRASIEITPPHKRTWWQNLHSLHGRQTALTDTAKWRAVAHTVVANVQALKGRPAREQESLYLSTVMLKHLLAKLSKPDVDVAAVEKALADNLRRQVAQAEAKANGKT